MACLRHHRVLYRSSFIIAVALLIALQAGTPAWAWGRLGHRVISRIAEMNLTPKARAAIAALLEKGESLADASLWADQNRRRLPETAPWHYVDVPLDEPRYDSKWSADNPEHGCVVDKINEFRKTLKDTTKSIEDRRFALRFLIHCVEDMHMPMHVGDNHDRGGNDTQVQFGDRGTNMHSLWDSGMLEHISSDEDYWLKELTVLPSAAERGRSDGRDGRRLGHGIIARGQGSIRKPRDGPADQAGDHARTRLPQQEHPDGEGTNVPGRHSASESVE